jgi:hypothetical protein
MKTKDHVEHQKQIYGIWVESSGYNKFWRSYLYTITHPEHALRLINFAIKVLIKANIVYSSLIDSYVEPDQSCDTCKLYDVCDLHSEELGISPCPEHEMR